MSIFFCWEEKSMFFKVEKVYTNYFFSELVFEDNSKLKIINNNLLLMLIKIIFGDKIINVNLNNTNIYQTSSYHLKKFLKTKINNQKINLPTQDWINQTVQAVKKSKPLSEIFSELYNKTNEQAGLGRVISPLNVMRKNSKDINLNKYLLNENVLKLKFNKKIDFLKSRARTLKGLQESVSFSDFFFQNLDDIDKIQIHYVNRFFFKYPKLNTADYQGAIYLAAFLLSLKVCLDKPLCNHDIEKYIRYTSPSSVPTDTKNILKDMERAFLSVLEWNVNVLNVDDTFLTIFN